MLYLCRAIKQLKIKPMKNTQTEKLTHHQALPDNSIVSTRLTHAHHYFITGKRGEPKKIILPRELVEYQTTI